MKRSTKRTLLAVVIAITLTAAAMFVGMKAVASETLTGLEDAAAATTTPDVEIIIESSEPSESETTPSAEPTTAPAGTTGTTGTAKPQPKPQPTTNLPALYEEEGPIDQNLVDNPIRGEDMTPVEVIEVIDEIATIENPTVKQIALLPEITPEQVNQAIVTVNNDRIAEVEGGSGKATTDVGISTIATLPETKGQDSVHVEVKVKQGKTTITTKVMVRVFNPAGEKHEYLYEGSAPANIPLEGGFGTYTVNVYQDVDGKGYQLTSRYTLEKPDPNAGQAAVEVVNTSLEEAEQQTQGTDDTFVDVDWSQFGF